MTPRPLRAARHDADRHQLTTRICAMIGGTGKDFDANSKHGPLIGYGDDFLTVRAVKLYADGALGSRGAAMLEPYSDDPGNRGLLFHTPAELTAMIGKALGNGYQVAIHALGDRANREVLDSYAAACKLHGGEDLRMTRIEAFRAFTLDAAWAAHQEKTLGTLEPGKWADFILVDHDLFKDPPQTIWKTRVLQTWVGGRRVYAATP